MEKSQYSQYKWKNYYMNPAFIVLKRQYWEEFRDGISSTEYRRYDKNKWCERLFPPGRRVILSMGYSGQRLYAVVKSSKKIIASEVTGTDGIAVLNLYGENALLLAIELNFT